MSSKVIIIGAGPIGLALAVSLGRAGIVVDVIDKQTAPMPRQTQDARVVVLNHAAQNLLEKLGIWSQLADVAGPIETMQLEVPGAPSHGKFSAVDTTFATLGMTVFIQDISCALVKACQEHPLVSLHWNTPAHDIVINKNEVTVNRQWDGACLIAADGAASVTRRLLGRTALSAPYSQSAHVATIQTQMPHGKCAFQWFLSEGPLAFLPLKAPQEISIVWTQSQAAFVEHQALSDEAFLKALSTASDHQLGSVTHIGQRFGFPLKSQWLDAAVQPRVAFVGDAWHSIHPLAGQGMNLGFQDVSALSAELSRASKVGIDIGALTVLQRYQNARAAQNRQMQQLMSFINKMGAIQGGCMPLLSGAGFGILNHWSSLRRWLVAQAQGE